MGAMRRFKKNTGKEINEIGTDISLMGELLACCIRSACNADNVKLDLNDEAVMDCLSLKQVTEFAESMADATEDSKKKP